MSTLQATRHSSFIRLIVVRLGNRVNKRYIEEFYVQILQIE